MGDQRQKTVIIESGFDKMELTLELEGGKFATTISVNGVLCHLEAIDAGKFMASYMVDDDPDYWPKADAQGHAFLLIPFSG